LAAALFAMLANDSSFKDAPCNVGPVGLWGPTIMAVIVY